MKFMERYHYSYALDVLRKKPVLLWGLTLMGNFLIILASILGAIPLISLPISVTLEASMVLLLLKGLEGKEVDSKDLFTGFSNFKHVAGGMLWMKLWVLLWALIPIAGPVLAVIKSYSYRFTPYILMTEPEVPALDALKKSMAMTEGRKGTMFLADFLFYLLYFVAMLVLGVLAVIPVLGLVFTLASMALSLAVAAFSSIFLGLVAASFYKEAVDGPAAPVPAIPAAPAVEAPVEEPAEDTPEA